MPHRSSACLRGLLPAIVLLVLSLAAIRVPGASAFPNEPDGFGEARFGTSLNQVRAHFPELEALLAPAASSAEFPITLETYQAKGQSVLGVSDCRVRFYFANDELYRVGFDCDEGEKLFAALKERFGVPDQEIDGNLHWLSDRRSVSVNPANRRVSYADRQRDILVQQLIFRYAQADPQQPQASPPAGPGAPAASPPKADTDFDWFDDDERLAALIERLDPKKEPSELVAVLEEIATFEEASSVPAIVPFLKHEDADVFDSAVAALEDVADGEAARALEVVFADPKADKQRRLRAIEALTVLRYEDGAAASLGKALADADSEVRREAAMTIVLTGDDGVPELLRKALAGETDPVTRQVLERGLEILGETPTKSAATKAGDAEMAHKGGESPKAQP